MKILIALLFVTSFAFGQADQSPIVVNLSDNPVLQYQGAAVKMKFIVTGFASVRNGLKDFYIEGVVRYYQNNAGAYGSQLTTVINADGTLSDDQKAYLNDVYNDRYITYTTQGHYVDASGNRVNQGAGGAQPELQYWQAFFLNQVAGVGTVANTKALDANYLTIVAIVTKLNTRKNL